MQVIMVLTEDVLEAGKSKNGGWSEAQLDLIGVAWPPTKGWKARVLGRWISAKSLSLFLDLKDKHLPAEEASLFPGELIP